MSQMAGGWLCVAVWMAGSWGATTIRADLRGAPSFMALHSVAPHLNFTHPHTACLLTCCPHAHPAGRYPVRRAPQPAELEQESTAARIQRLQALMAAGRAAEAAGDYETALASYDSAVRQFPDFATTEYSRLARGLTLYQLGRTSDAILQLEDLEVTLRGYAEVHAALAAVLYVERPSLLQSAETQWEIAMEFNRQFSDPQWVAATKHWPPRMMAALDRFLRLS